MRVIIPFVVVLSVLLLADCSGSDQAVTAPQVDMQLYVSRNPAHPWQEVTVNVIATSPDAKFVALHLDFTGDGNWDVEQTVDDSRLNVGFIHLYSDVGTYEVVAEVVDANNVSTRRTLPLSVTSTLPVYIAVYAQTSDPLGSAWAEGPPMACVGCTFPLSINVQTLQQIASMAPGDPISITQLLEQRPFSTPQRPYRVEYALWLVAGEEPYWVAFASGNCVTDSNPPNPVLTCSSSMNGVVPIP